MAAPECFRQFSWQHSEKCPDKNWQNSILKNKGAQAKTTQHCELPAETLPEDHLCQAAGVIGTREWLRMNRIRIAAVWAPHVWCEMWQLASVCMRHIEAHEFMHLGAEMVAVVRNKYNSYNRYLFVRSEMCQCTRYKRQTQLTRPVADVRMALDW